MQPTSAKFELNREARANILTYKAEMDLDDLALDLVGGVATASSSYGADYPAVAINNGNITHRNYGLNSSALLFDALFPEKNVWQSALETNPWAKIDLGAAKTINKIEMYGHPLYPDITKFKIETSLDDSIYTAITNYYKIDAYNRNNSPVPAVSLEAGWSIKTDMTMLPSVNTPPWTFGGTTEADCTVAGGILTIDPVDGSGGNAWYQIATTLNSVTGYTIEFKMKVITNADGKSIIVGIFDGVNFDQLYIKPWEISLLWGIGSYSMDTTDMLHTYRIEVLGSTYKVYVDGGTTPVIDTVFGNTGSQNVVSFGDIEPMTTHSKSEWEYFYINYSPSSLSIVNTNATAHILYLASGLSARYVKITCVAKTGD